MCYVSAYPVAGQPPAGYVPAPPPTAYGGEFVFISAWTVHLTDQLDAVLNFITFRLQ